MTSEIRANILKNRVGLGTVSFTNTGPVISGIVTIANSTSEGVRLEDNAGVGNSLKITTPTGYVSIGAGNATFVHLQTDRGIFYFNRRISVDEGIISSYDEDLVLQSPMNTNRMTINKTTGLVSIVNDLDVDGHTNLDNVSIAGITTVNGGFIFDNGTNAGKDLQWQPSNNRLAFFNDVKATFGNTVDLQIYNNSTENHIYGSTSKPIIFSTNTGERLRIASDGKIGIGVDPTVRFHIKLSSRTSDFRITDSDSSADVLRAGAQPDGDGLLQLRTTGGSGPVLFDASGTSYITGGNFGVGTVSPTRSFHVKGMASGNSTNRMMIIESTGTAGSFLAFQDANTTDDSKCRIGSVGGNVIGIRGDSHSFQDGGGNNRMIIDSSGRVIIGDTNTNNAFSGGDSLVIGNTPSGTRSGITLVSNSSTDGGIYFSTGSSNQTMGQVVYNHPDNSLRFYANNLQRFRIKSDGSAVFAGDTVTLSSDTSHTPSLNEKLIISNRYVDVSSTVIDLDTSGNLGQSLNLKSHSSATNHYAVLTFDSGSLKSAIAGGRPNAGNWGTELRFYTHPSTTSNVHKTYEKMRIDNEGSISLSNGRVNDAGHQTYRYGGRIAGTATVSVDIPVFNDGNIYWIEAFYTHHSLSYGGYLYGVYGAYSGHNGLQINNTIGSSTAGGGNAGTWSVTRGNAGQPVVVAKSAGSYGGMGYWWIHVHAGTSPIL